MSSSITITNSRTEFNLAVIAGIVVDKEDVEAVKGALEHLPGNFIVSPEDAKYRRIGITESSQGANLLNLQKELIKLVRAGKMSPICISPAVPKEAITEIRVENGVVRREFFSHLGLPMGDIHGGRKGNERPMVWFIQAEVKVEAKPLPQFTCWLYSTVLDQEQWTWQQVIGGDGHPRCVRTTGKRLLAIVNANEEHMEHYVIPMLNKAEKLAEKMARKEATETRAANLVSAGFVPPRPMGTIGEAMAAAKPANPGNGAHKAA